MDFGKLRDLLGLGPDEPEELEAAMEHQLLPESRPVTPGTGAKTGAGPDPTGAEAPPPPDEAPPARARFIVAGRCPSCGDPVIEGLEAPCAWCNKPCRPDQDGFHLVHIALGAYQERHRFCSDDCYEAFRRMYPARVHRNCYEQDCNACTYCVKRYTDESEGLLEQDDHPDEGKNGATRKED
jgi:hypothetical protein